MKTLLLTFALLFTITLSAQTPKGMVKIDYKKAFKEAAQEADRQLAPQLQEIRNEISSLKTQFSILHDNGNIITNAKILPDLLEEFYDAARFYRIDYSEKLANLEKVLVKEHHLSFLGAISPDEKIIYLNSALLKYPNLLRVILFRQLGKLHGAKPEKQGRGIMSTLWKINEKHEDFAYEHRRRNHQKEKFFKKLYEQNGLKKQL